MPIYDYQAINEKGKPISGVLVAGSESELQDNLRAAGAWLLKASVRKPKANSSSGSGPKLKRRVLIDFTLQLGILARAGVPLDEALTQLAGDAEDPGLKRVLEMICLNIRSGVSLYGAMVQFPRTFPDLYLQLIQAGEASGNLPIVLRDLQRYLEWLDELAAETRQATTYPIVVGIAVGLLVAVLFTWVIPQFTELFAKLGVGLPLPTRLVMGVSQFFTQWWWALLLAGIFLPLSINLAQRYSAGFRYQFEGLKLGLPIFGVLRRQLALSRFSHNLSILFNSGIPMLTCLEILPTLVANPVVARAVTLAAERVEQGEGVADSFRKHAIFDPLVLRMLAVGESSGQMGESLEQAAQYYDTIIPRAVKRFFSLLEPTLILVMVGIVGLVALAIFLPLLSLGSAIR